MSETDPTAVVSPLRHMVRGSLWAIALRWSDRLTGIVSMVVLARLLTPVDYGVVAIAGLVVGTIEIFTWTGQYNAIVRHPNPTRDHYDSAWTVSLLLGLGLGLLILLATPLTVSYFHEPRASAVVEVLAFRTMLMGTQNIGIVNFQRNLQFRKQFWFSITPTFISFAAAMISAFVLRNYWALVIGIMVKYVSTVALSYIMEPFRPRISLGKVREIWSFSIWSLLRNIGSYLGEQIDKIAIGGFAGAASMGRYDVGREVAVSPTRELNAPVVMTLVPVMAKVQGDKEKRRALYLNVLYWSALICTSTSVGVALVTNDMVDLVLGAKWHDVKPLMPWFALAFGALSLTSSVYSAFDTIGRPDISARLQWTRAVGLALCIFPVAFFLRDLRDIAITRFIVAIVVTPLLFVSLARALDLHVREFATTLWRPFAAGLFMAAVVLSINASISFSGVSRLLLDVAAGSFSYGIALMALWMLSRRPEGPETLLWSYWQRLWTRAQLRAVPVAESASPSPDGNG